MGEVIAGFGNFASIVWWIQWFWPSARYGNRKFVGSIKTDVGVSGDDGGGGYPRHGRVKYWVTTGLVNLQKLRNYRWILKE